MGPMSPGDRWDPDLGTRQGPSRSCAIRPPALPILEGLLTKCKRWCTDDFEAHKIIGQGAFGTVSQPAPFRKYIAQPQLIRVRGKNLMFPMFDVFPDFMRYSQW